MEEEVATASTPRPLRLTLELRDTLLPDAFTTPLLVDEALTGVLLPDTAEERLVALLLRLALLEEPVPADTPEERPVTLLERLAELLETLLERLALPEEAVPVLPERLAELLETPLLRLALELLLPERTCEEELLLLERTCELEPEVRLALELVPEEEREAELLLEEREELLPVLLLWAAISGATSIETASIKEAAMVKNLLIASKVLKVIVF